MNPFASIQKSRAVIAGLIIGLASMLALADEPSNPAPTTPVVVSAITRPSKERQLKFAGPGIVSEVTVKEGDLVKTHDVLARQDSRQDAWQLKSDLREAESNEKIDYSKADLSSKVVDQKRKHELRKDNAVSETEVEQADLAVALAQAQVNLAIMEQDQKHFDAEKERVKIEQMTIFSPIDGVVEKLNVGEGEMGDPQSRDGAIVIGQWNPLWLEMHLPSAQASKLKPNQELQVEYDGGQWQTARIIFFEKVDAASDTQLVRMEMANPDNTTPGLHMKVKLPSTAAVASAR